MRLMLAILMSGLVFAFTAAAPALAQKRVALVIGINDYPKLDRDQQLKKAVNDAESVATALRSTGFDVLHENNVDRLTFIRLWQRFLNKLEPGDIAALFFSGHGVEIDGSNFLVPGDVPKLQSGEKQVLKASAISFHNLLLDLQRKKTKVNIAIIDACRENPFAQGGTKSMGGTRGLVRTDIEPGSGTFVMYSAGVNELALDRLPNRNDPSPNSIYTRNLLPLLTTPGMSMTQIAKKVRSQVRELAKTVSHKQNPAYYDQMTEEFFLAGKNAGGGTIGGGGNQGGGGGTQTNHAALALDEARLIGTTAAYQSVIDRFPNSPEAAMARRLLEQKKLADAEVAAARDFDHAKRIDTPDAYLEFRRRHPFSRFAKDAERLYRAKIDEQRWDKARRQNTIAAYREYTLVFPNGMFVDQANAEIRRLEGDARRDRDAWSTAQQIRTREAYEEYIRRFPNGRFAQAARAEIRRLEDDAIRDRQAWNTARSIGTRDAYREYMLRFPSGQFIHEARRQLSILIAEDNAWNNARAQNTISAYRFYLSSYPNGKFASLARQRIRDLDTPPPPPPDPLQVFRGYDAFGGDYRTLKGVSYSRCFNACSGESHCKAFTYNTKVNWCFLKSRVNELRPISIGIAGVRSSLRNRIRFAGSGGSGGGGGGGFRILRNRDVRAQDYASREGVSRRQCQAICAANGRCRSYAYITRLRSCWLKTGARPILRKRGVVLGIKQ